MKNGLAWRLAGEDEQIYEALVAALEGEARMARDARIYTRYATTTPAPTDARADRQTHQAIVTANALINAASALLRNTNNRLENI